MGPSNALLMQIAQGAQPRMADAMARGYGQGNAMLKMQQEQETRNALAQAATMIGQGNTSGARQMLGQSGQFEPAYNLLAAEQKAEAQSAKDALPVSPYGLLMYDERRNLVPAGTTQRKIGAIGKGGTTVNVNTGENIPLGTKATNDTKDNVLTGRIALANTKNIMRNYDPSWLTWRGQLEAKGARVAEKAGFGELVPDDSKERLGKYTRFKNAVNTEFNRYRKEITGAAAAMQEIEMLRQAIFNTDQSPTEFEAAMADYVSTLQRLDEIRINLLEQGIDPRTPEGGSILDAEFFGTARQPQGAANDDGWAVEVIGE